MKPEATTIYVVLSRIVYILREFSVRGICVKTFKFEEMGSDKIQARMNIFAGEQDIFVERISLGSLRQSLWITVATLTDPHVILHWLWCAY